MSYPEAPFLFKNLFALGSVNLLAGMSGGGKSRFNFQLLEEIEQRSTLLGFPSLIPISTTYFAFDRPLSSVHKTLNTMGCTLRTPLVSAFDQSRTYEELTLPKPDQLRGYQLAIFDGLDCLVPKLSDSREVGRLLFQCTKLAQKSNCTILAILGTAKVKEGEGYSHPRERIIGSTFWGRLSDDIILISSKDDPSEPMGRIISILPRNAPEFNLDMIFQNGRLIRTLMLNPESDEMKLYSLLPVAFTTSEAQSLASTLGLSRATLFRYLTRLTDQQLIKQAEKGSYLKVTVN